MRQTERVALVLQSARSGHDGRLRRNGSLLVRMMEMIRVCTSRLGDRLTSIPSR
jgi:hypothetical protein